MTTDFAEEVRAFTEKAKADAERKRAEVRSICPVLTARLDKLRQLYGSDVRLVGVVARDGREFGKVADADRAAARAGWAA